MAPDFVVSCLHQYLSNTVLQNSLSGFAHIYSIICTSLFPEEATSEIAHTFLLPLPSICYDISMGLCFCISVLDWIDILLKLFQILSDSPSDLFQTCFASPHSGWIPGSVSLAQCPIAVAKSSDKCLHVSSLINVSATSLKTSRSFFQFFFSLLPFYSIQIMSKCYNVRCVMHIFS